MTHRLAGFALRPADGVEFSLFHLCILVQRRCTMMFGLTEELGKALCDTQLDPKVITKERLNQLIKMGVVYQRLDGTLDFTDLAKVLRDALTTRDRK
jgi:hypothetical protein